jgi:hypothetical protein
MLFRKQIGFGRHSLLLVVCFALTACDDRGADSPAGPGGLDPPPNQAAAPEPAPTDGATLASQFCQTCHLLVPPSMLPKRIWRDTIIPRMGARLGMHNAGYDYLSKVNTGGSERERSIIGDAGVFPSAAVLSNAQWEALTDYLISNAPDDLLPPDNLPPINPNLDTLRARTWPLSRANPMTVALRIDEPSQQLLVGDMTRQSVSVLDANGRLVQELQLGRVPVNLRRANDSLWITTIGSVGPSDEPSGALLVAERLQGRYRMFPESLVLGGLRRPTYASFADLNGDGREDVVMSEFGQYLGQLAWYEGTGTDEGYRRHVLLAEAGSMTSEVRDLDGDGLPDVAAILGQNREGVHVFFNRGAGNFDYSYAVPVPPVYGSSHFSFYDFNSDGYLDILATSGDNGDYEAILKPYHGVRIYLNDTANRYTEAYFFPQNGAYKALAADFDADGDLDIVSISMFADYANRPEEGFVYLENRGALAFEASTVPEVGSGRWLTMDIGDLDGDSDVDVVLGSFVAMLTPVPDQYAQRWSESTLPVLYLENQLR